MQADTTVRPFKGKQPSNPIVAEMKAQESAPPEPPPALPAPAEQSAPPVVSLSDPPSPLPTRATPIPDAPKTVCPTLVHILSTKRGHGSASEGGFLVWLHSEIKARGAKSDVRALGCITVTIPHPGGNKSTTLFSCHVDTVDFGAGTTPQKIVYDPDFGHIFLDKDDPQCGTCLGADDGAGVWLMLEMIKAKVPGSYAFHRGEEKGGEGSKAMLQTNRAWLEQFETAIAFDRADCDEVITHQGSMECASDKFGEALAKALNAADTGFTYKTSRGGVFTDTRVYRGVIAECVNIGVGYWAQHGKSESLDYAHLVRLRDACLSISWDALPVDRDPAKSEYDWRGGGSKYGGYNGRGYGGYGDFGAGGKYEDPKGYAGGKTGKKKKPTKQDDKQLSLDLEQEIYGMGFGDVLAWVEDDPLTATSLLVDYASEIAALKTKIDYLKGALK